MIHFCLKAMGNDKVQPTCSNTMRNGAIGKLVVEYWDISEILFSYMVAVKYGDGDRSPSWLTPKIVVFTHQALIFFI